MLRDTDAVATLAVKDLGAAAKFYEETLGLTEVDDFGEGFMLKSGDTEFSVYRSEFAGTNKATAATWGVGDELDSIVQSLRSKGVTFEHYDLPETTRDGDIHEMGDGMRGVWFKDPSGNIISLVNAT